MNEVTGGTTADESGIPTDPEGINLIDRYSSESARRSEALHGPFPPYYGIEDVCQKVHIYLWKWLGPGYSSLIAQAARCKDSESDPFRKLREAVKQAIGDCRWTEDKRKQRGLRPRGGAATRDYRTTLDKTIDLYQAMAEELTPLEQRVLVLRMQRYTGDDIAQILGLGDKRRVSEIARTAFEKLAPALEPYKED